MDVERAADRGDRLLVEIDADRRQRARMVAVAARGDAADIDVGRARLEGLVGDARAAAGYNPGNWRRSGSSSCWVPSAWMLIGTFCRFSERFCAVTMMTSPSSCRGCGRAAGRGLGGPWAKAAPLAQSMVEPAGRKPVRLKVTSITPPWRLLPREIRRFSAAGQTILGAETRSSATCDRLPRCDQRPIVEDRAERLLERIEPGLVGRHWSSAVAVDRAADLLGAGGADRARIFVEGEAGGLERQAEMVEQRAGSRPRDRRSAARGSADGAGRGAPPPRCAISAT